ncbi:hypothetical protein M0802_006433 [Mischocyttarus mexicanus]|nr:hypothetical protein M0802_006433 [Mischocyttarus mexicanus]
MLKSTTIIYIIIQCLINCSLVLCNEDNIIYSEGDTNNDSDFESKQNDEFHETMDEEKHKDDLNRIEDLIDPHSLFYDRSSKQVIEDVKLLPIKSNKIFNTEEKELKSLKGCNEECEDCKMLKVYYVRLIKMLLTNSNLKMDDDLVEGHLLLKGTKMQIEKLKKVNTRDYSLKEIDLILNKIILEPSYVDIAFNTINFNRIIQPVCQFINNYIEVIIIAVGALAALILCKTMPYNRMIFFFIVIGISVSYFMTYLELVTEAKIKSTAAQFKYIEMPIECKPHEMNLWDKMKAYFFADGDECEKYYKAKMSTQDLSVTPILVLSKLFFTVLFHPVTLFGETISKFVTSSTDNLPFSTRYIVQVILYLFLPVFMIIVVIVYKGGSMRLGLGSLNCGFSTSERNSLPSDEAQKRQTIELIREVFSELPANIPLGITANNNLPNTLEIKENDSPTDNVNEKPCKLMPDKSLKELNPEGGDADINNLFSEESEKKTCECVKSVKNNTEIGAGDA